MGQVAKIYRIVRWVMFAGLILTIFLMLKTPAPVAFPLEPAAARLNSQSFEQKLSELETSQSLGESDAEVRFTAGEVNAAIGQSMAQPTAVQPTRARPQPASADQIPIKSTQVSFEGDVVKGQFLAQVYGRDLYLTVAGRLGARDGYATFDPTEFRVGDLSVPVSLVNPALQRKLAEPENREKLKLPGFVKGLRVENSELVITR